MNGALILDNSFGVPANVAGIFGLDSFADLIISKRSIRHRLGSICTSLSWADLVVLDGGPIRSNVAHRLERLAKTGGCAIYLPSYLHLGTDDAGTLEFFEKLAYTTQSLGISQHVDQHGDLGRSGDRHSPPAMLVLQGADLLAFVQAPSGETRHTELQQMTAGWPLVPPDFPLLDLRDTEQFLRAVTSTFDARHFNRVSSSDRYTITKHSTEVAKLRREFEVFSLLPAAMRRFFIEPFDFKEDNRGASYRLERLLVPDFALQWLHNSVRTADFEQFMRHIFYFLSERQTRPCDARKGKDVADALYVDKVVERVNLLQRLPGFNNICMHAEQAFGGVDALLQRYLALYRQLSQVRRHDHVAVIHGDLCFSNILYNGSLGTLKLIDPRGAASTDDLYSDPLYDLAKLSHSIEGHYDYINAGRFSVELDSGGKPSLRLDAPSRPAEVRVFRRHCRDMGTSPRTIRLLEASLFISMTPLHIESPLKVLAFLLNARNILDEVENAAPWENNR